MPTKSNQADLEARDRRIAELAKTTPRAALAARFGLNRNRINQILKRHSDKERAGQ